MKIWNEGVNNITPQDWKSSLTKMARFDNQVISEFDGSRIRFTRRDIHDSRHHKLWAGLIYGPVFGMSGFASIGKNCGLCKYVCVWSRGGGIIGIFVIVIRKSAQWYWLGPWDFLGSLSLRFSPSQFSELINHRILVIRQNPGFSLAAG